MEKIIITLTGPSGVGKGYLKTYLKKKLCLKEIPVYTTRTLRLNESNEERIFVDKKNFLKLVKNKQFLFVNRILGNFYGFLKKDFLSPPKRIILEIYVNNVRKFKKYFPNSLMIAILPSNLEFLKYRLKKRRIKTGEKGIIQRLKNASKEIKKIQKLKKYFDLIYIVGKQNEKIICQEIENWIKSHLSIC